MSNRIFFFLSSQVITLYCPHFSMFGGNVPLVSLHLVFLSLSIYYKQCPLLMKIFIFFGLNLVLWWAIPPISIYSDVKQPGICCLLVLLQCFFSFFLVDFSLIRLFTNEVMALLNMKGKGKKDKMGIEDTNLFSAIKGMLDVIFFDTVMNEM